MAKLDFPSSPTDGQVYAAPNGANYTWNDSVGVWTAKTAEPLNLVNPGYISGTPQVGQTLAYAEGSATGGVPPYNYTWTWRKASDGSNLQTGGATYVVPSELIGDNVYVELVVTDSLADTDSGVTNVFPFGTTITAAPFPNSAFLPAGAPNASPPEVSTATLHGTGTCDSWEDGFTTLFSTGGILFSVNNGAFGTGGTNVSDGDTVDVIWDVAVVAAASDGQVLTGTLSDGTYVNVYTLTVTRGTVTGLSGFANLVDQPLSTAVTSDVVTPEGFNVPVTFAFAGSATPLTSLGVSVSGGAFSASPQTVNPGDTLQLQGTTGGSNSTAYGVDVTMGSPAATQTWTVTTASVAATIAQPSITSPANGTTDLNPALNSPGGIQLVGSDYDPLNGAGAQTSSDWEVYKANQINPETSGISNVTSSGTSPGAVGSSFGGGFYAGDYTDGGVRYNLILAPKSTERSQCVVAGNVQYKVSGNTADPNPPSQDTVYGKTATDAFNDADHPACQAAKSVSAGGFTDWYVPAENELSIVYNAFYPGSTSVPDFQPGGSEIFCAYGYGSATGGVYFSTTQNSGTPGAQVGYYFGTPDGGTPGRNAILAKTGSYSMRAVRRQAAPTTTLTLTDGTNLSNFQVGDSVSQVGGGASGTIGSIDLVNNKIVLSTSTGTWTNGSFVRDTSRTITAPAPTTDPPSATDYTQIVNVSGDTSNLLSYLIPQASLAVSSTYYARVQYATTNATAATSEFSAWSSFSTASSFAIPPGTPMEGGYFAGQIVGSGSTSGAGGLDNSGTIYNIIVAPVSSGSLSGTSSLAGVQYRTSNASNAIPSTQDLNFGGLGTSALVSNAAFPAFNAFINGATGPNAGAFNLATGGAGGGTGIGGYNDWYLPAKNELAILYFFLKPDSTANNTGSGSNPVSVAPYTQNTNYGGGFPNISSSDLFAGGPQAFAATTYWSSSENAFGSTTAWNQTFNTGQQAADPKSGTCIARAIRRVAA